MLGNALGLGVNANDVFGFGFNIGGVNVPARGPNIGEATAAVSCRTVLTSDNLATNISSKISRTVGNSSRSYVSFSLSY